MVERRKLLDDLKSLVDFLVFKLKGLDAAKQVLGKKLCNLLIERGISKITMRKYDNVHDGGLVALKYILEVIKL